MEKCIVVIGGGAAGLMAAITAARQGAQVTLLEQNGAEEVTVATWFLQKPELKREGDIRLTEEDQLQALLEQGKYDLLIGDKTMWAVAPSCTVQQLDLIHFAVSGRTEEPWRE